MLKSLYAKSCAPSQRSLAFPYNFHASNSFEIFKIAFQVFVLPAADVEAQLKVVHILSSPSGELHSLSEDL